MIQTINYWPENTVFVSVVDPGVGSDRKSVVVKTNSGRYIVTPDNGTLTHVIRLEGIAEARVIDETINRLPCSGESYTFHGRDVYAYTGARLASGIIDFEGVGPALDVSTLTSLPIVEPVLDGKKKCPENPMIATGRLDAQDVVMEELGIHYEKVDIRENNTTGWAEFNKDTLGRLLACNFSTDDDSLANVVNMGLKDAVYLLENCGYKVAFQGYGKVVDQEPKAGSRPEKGTTIKLILKEDGNQ